MTRKRNVTNNNKSKESFKSSSRNDGDSLLISPSDISDDDKGTTTPAAVVTSNSSTSAGTGTVAPKESSLKKILIRTVLGFCMTGYYLSMLRGGHMYCILTGVLTQAELFRELVNVRYRTAQEKEVPLFRTVQWIWFFLAMISICKPLPFSSPTHSLLLNFSSRWR
jgi:phosphatidate cytidylyltransferase